MGTTIQTIKELSKTKGFKKWFFAWFAIYAVGVVTYIVGCGAGILESFYHAFTLFTFNVYPSLGGKEATCDISIYLVAFAAAAYTSSGVFSLIIKQFKDTKTLADRTEGKYILVFGLGDKAAAYIDSEISSGSQNIVVVEHDLHNTNIEKYRAKGVAVKIADAKDVAVLRGLNLGNAKHMVALTGSNTDNLEIALALKDVFSEESISHKDLYMRIDDNSLSKLYKDGGLLDDSSNLIIHMFSMARNSARELFMRHSIDGKSREYIDSDKSFGIVVAGASQLAVEVVGQICELAHLPNENRVTIYCIDEDICRFKQMIGQRYTQIEQIPNISIEFLALNKNSRGFYADSVWHKELTHLVLAYEDSRSNIAVATELADSTYLNEIEKLNLKPHIHIAIYENRVMAKEIDSNQDNFGYFDTFACTEKMASKDMIIDETSLWIAKCIHSGYKEQYFPDTTYGDTSKIEDAWLKVDNLNNRPSNMAQAYHMTLKLKALGLTYKESDKNPDNELISYNRKMLNAKIKEELKSLKLDDKSLMKRTKDNDVWENVEKFDYFPSEYKLMVEKLIRAEHNRWNAYHYLRGWIHAEDETNKPLKEHRCLTPMPQMDDRDKYTVLYDLFSILYIPNLLASVPPSSSDKEGYELTELNDA